MEWRQAAELFGAKTLFAESSWRQWERIMRLPRRFAVPISDSHATIVAPPSEQRSRKEADKISFVTAALGSIWPVEEAMEASRTLKRAHTHSACAIRAARAVDRNLKRFVWSYLAPLVCHAAIDTFNVRHRGTRRRLL